MADPAVKLAQTVGLPDETLGEIVVSCVVPHDGKALTEDGVRAALREQLASYKVPRRIVFLASEELETTGSAKIKTAELRTLTQERLDLEDLQGN